MIVTYHGGQCFKLVRGDTTIAFDPIAKNGADFPAVRFGADVVFSTLQHPNFMGHEQMHSANRTPFIVTGPGEYEIGEVTARGFGVKTNYQGVERYNTIYYIQFDGMNILFLGALGDPDIGSDILGSIADVDMLFIPVGGGDVLEAPQASKLGVKLEADVVIPMHYDETSLGAFLKEEGIEKPTFQDKLTIKQKDLGTLTSNVVVLKS